MSEKKRRAFLESPIGWLTVAECGGAVAEAFFMDKPPRAKPDSSPCLDDCLGQLREYFSGQRRAFALRLDPAGTAFQSRVWEAVLKIPFGRTSTYGAIARSLGNRNAVRAVGAANGRNPIPVIIPCHRVVGSSGALVGYGGGLWRKEWLLRHEGAPGYGREGAGQMKLAFKKG